MKPVAAQDPGTRTAQARRADPVVCLLLASAAFLALAAPDLAAAQQDPAEPAATPVPAAPPATLGRVYLDWLESVAGLITPAERAYFVGLAYDYQRDAFMEAFWQPRDPEPLTPRNELRDRWQAATAGGSTASTADPRFMFYLLNGPPGAYALPDGRPVARCFSRSYDLEIWFYGGSERTSRRFPVIFYRVSAAAPWRIYRPGEAIRPTRRAGPLPTTDVRELCADDLLRFAAGEALRMGNYAGLIDELMTPPTPPDEWLASLRLGGAQVPAGADLLELTATIDFPARRQSRTAVRVLLEIPLEEAPGRRFEGRLFHLFEVSGDVIRDGRLFESFSYRFEGSTPEEATRIPLGFTRYLRPGAATVRIVLRDLYGERFAEVLRDLEVPSPTGLPSDPGESLMARLAGGSEGAPTDRPTLRLDGPTGANLAGPVRFTAQATGGELDKVTFFLDERPVFTLRKAPWSAELNLGPTPAPHRVRAVGFVGEEEVSSDQLWLNQAAARFRARLVEPRAGGIYPGSLTARVVVETPDGQAPERVEIELDGRTVATLGEPPYETVLELGDSAAAVVRAVAYLADGSAAEDAVLVNASGLTEAVEVRLVELPVLAENPAGEPVTNLTKGDFRLFEDGRRQEIQRLVAPGESSLQAALVIDRSASMESVLAQVTAAAAGFARAAATSPADRVALVSFADRLAVDVPFTDRPAELERALAGLTARGGTALYDGVARAAVTFQEAPGQRVLVLFTDGADEGSGLDVAAAIDAARRHGVVIFALAPEGAFADRRARRDLERLAEETGGRAWLLDSLDDLAGVYDAILARLRASYILAYQPAEGAGDEPRRIRIEVDREGVVVRAPSAVYP